MNRRFLAAFPVPALIAALVAAASAVLVAQTAPEPSQRQPDRFAITLEGCVRGNTFTPAKTGGSRAQSEVLKVTEYQLRGSRALMRALRDEHDGHTEEILGTVEIPRETRTRAGVLTKEVGKGRIVVGQRQAPPRPDPEQAVRPAWLTIEATRHVSNSCSD